MHGNMYHRTSYSKKQRPLTYFAFDIDTWLEYVCMYRYVHEIDAARCVFIWWLRCDAMWPTRMSMIMWQWQIDRFVLFLQHRISKTKHATQNYLHFNKTVWFMWLTLMSLPKQTVNLDDPTIGSRSFLYQIYIVNLIL